MPRCACAYAIRGWAYSGLGNLNSALVDLNESARMDPKSPIVYIFHAAHVPRRVTAGGQEDTMPRVKLELPEEFNFSTDIQVRRSDINAGNHVGADTLLLYTTEAMVVFLRKIGFSESDRKGSGLIMTDATLVFKSQAFYGETLRIEVAVTDFTKKSCSFYYLLTNRETGREIARVRTNMVFFDYGTQKAIDVPAKFRGSF